MKYFSISLLFFVFCYGSAYSLKIKVIVRNDLKEAVSVDIYGSNSNVDAGNIVFSFNSIGQGETKTKDKLTLPSGYIFIKAKTKTASGKIIETEWENVSSTKFFSKQISESNGAQKDFDFKNFASIDRLFQYEPSKFVRENGITSVSLKPLNNLYEEYLGGILLFLEGEPDSSGNKEIIYVDKVSPKELKNAMTVQLGGTSNLSQEFDFETKVGQNLGVSIVNLFGVLGSIEHNKIYHFKVAYNGVGTLSYTSPVSQSINQLFVKLDTARLRSIGMLAYKYGEKLIASQITQGYGFMGIYSEVSEYVKLTTSNQISYNTFGTTSGNYNRSLDSKTKVTIGPSFLGYYANRINQIDLSVPKTLYLVNIFYTLNNMPEGAAKMYYEGEKVRNPNLPNYTTKEAALGQLASLVAVQVEKPVVSTAIDKIIPPQILQNIKNRSH